MPSPPPPDHAFQRGDELYVIAHDPTRPEIEIGTVLTVDESGVADGDDEISVEGVESHGYGFVRRLCISYDLSTPADLPTDLSDPEEVRRWLDQ